MHRLIAILLLLLASPLYAATCTSITSGPWSDGDTWDGDVPADGDTVIVASGHAVEFDVDQSAFAGLASLTIQGGATPGRLYAKYSAGGPFVLKMANGANIQGTTSGGNRGVLCANSDGTAAGTGTYPYDRKFTILLSGTGAGYVNAENLDINFRCTIPTNRYVECYGQAYGPVSQATNVNTTTGVIDWGETPPAANTAVRVRSSGTLPTGLTNHDIYYVYNVSGTTCQLALQSNVAATVVIPSTVGTGNLTLYRGYTPASESLWGVSDDTPLVIQDITSDSWSDGDAVVLCNEGPQNYDQQRLTISDRSTAGQITLSAGVDSVQYPLAKLVLSTRNISVQSGSSTSSKEIIRFASGSTHGANLQCELRNTAGTGTTFYGYGVSYGVGCVIEAISGCSQGCYFGSGYTISGIITGCNNGCHSGSGHTISGTISGCSQGCYFGSGYTISGTITGCNNGCIYGSGHTISGTISGCSLGCYFGSGYTISGIITGCNYGCHSGSGHTISGTITGCNYGCHYGSYTLQKAIFDDNSCDLRTCVVEGFAASLRGSTQVYQYAFADLGKVPACVIIYDPIDATDTTYPGRILAWMAGGICADNSSPPASAPVGVPAWCHRFTFDNDGSGEPLFVDQRVRVKSGQTLSVPVYLKCSVNGSTMDECPRVQIIDPNEGWDTEASKLDDDQIADTTDWQTVTVTYTADYDKEVIVRVRGSDDGGTTTLDWYADLDGWSAGSGGGGETSHVWVR
ncbi:MAG: hypothetical protein WCS62_07250 [Bacilli bacterium]